jgi:hypothetical protein
MHDLVDWLKNLLSRHGLQRPDRRMLFGYDLTHDEYSELRELLAKTLNHRDFSYVSMDVPGFAAAFVLFAAEWWKREYEGGAWPWTPIVESIAGEGVEFPHQARSECVTCCVACFISGCRDVQSSC